MSKDTFVRNYHKLHDENSALVQEVKAACELVEAILEKTGVKSREMSLAMTNLEQASMWGVKAIALADKANGSQPLTQQGEAK